MGHGDIRQTILYTQRDIERRRRGIHAIMSRIMAILSEGADEIPQALELPGTSEKGEAA